MSKNTVENPKVVSRAEWIAARKELLAKEKTLTKQRDAVSAERRQLPWVKVDKEYVFDAPGGKKTLADLFEGRGQLIVYHFMFGPDWKEGCPSCSFNMDHTDAALVHLAQRDVSFAAISRATLPQIEAFKKRMGWRFAWASSNGNDVCEAWLRRVRKSSAYDSAASVMRSASLPRSSFGSSFRNDAILSPACFFSAALASGNPCFASSPSASSIKVSAATPRTTRAGL